jgi:hypothetical protein
MTTSWNPGHCRRNEVHENGKISRLEYGENSDIMNGLNTNPVVVVTENYGYLYNWWLETPSYSKAL